MPIRTLAACAVGALALLASASPAAAFEPPELFVRTASAQPGPWIPLASAPQVDYMGGWEIGYRVQSADLHAVALSVTGVPDGVPNQRRNTPAFCGDVAGNVGEIERIGSPIIYEGNGTYGVTVTLGNARRSGPGDCSGPSSTGSFSTNIQVTPTIFGTPLAVRIPRWTDYPYPGVQATHPPGGEADIQCALDASVQPDGSLRGQAVAESSKFKDFAEVEEFELTPPGEWTCVARGVVETEEGSPLRDGDETRYNASSWSPPLPVTVKADFQRTSLYVSGKRGKVFRFKYTAQFPRAAVGGTGTVRIERVVRCRRGKLTLKKVSARSAKFDAKGHVKISVPKPKAEGFYAVRFGIAGAPYYRDNATTPRSVWFEKIEGRYPILPHPPVC